MKRIYFAWMLGILFLAFGCEDLEDTYSDYAGDGMIRYVGKCTDVTVKLGWERLIVEWKNNLDPAIENIRLTCQVGKNMVADTLLEASATLCEIKNLENENYEINVYAVDGNGNMSLSETRYGRPVTSKHESVESFTMGVTKYFFMGNNIAMFFDNNSNNILNIQLQYYDTEGKLQTEDSLQKKFGMKYMLLENVDVSREVVINRKGRVGNCVDDIIFAPYSLKKDDWTFSASFRSFLKMRYGVEDITNEFVEDRKVLEFDYDIMSFEDILYFPNLERIVLGGNRYIEPQLLQLPADYHVNMTSELYEMEKSVFALQMAQKLRGLKIERYNQHYFSDDMLSEIELDVEKMGNPVLREPVYLDAKNWTITCSEPYDSKPENLLDNNYMTAWKTSPHSKFTTYELLIDMNSVQVMNGMKIAQALDLQAMNSSPNRIEIQVSEDNITWEYLTYQLVNSIGNSLGEITLFHLDKPKQIRYIKLGVSDVQGEYTASIALGDVAVF